MRRFDVATMFGSLWLLASMIIDIATLHGWRSDSACYVDHGPPVLATGAEAGLCPELHDALVGLRNVDRADLAEAVIAVFCRRGVCTNGDRRHCDPFPKLATFEAEGP